MTKDKKKVKVQNTLKAAIEAFGKTKESMKAAVRPSQRIIEAIKQKHKSIEHLKKFAFPSPHIAKMMRQIKQQQQVYANMIRPFESITLPDYTYEIRQIISQLKFSNSTVEALKQYQQAFDPRNMFRSIIEEQHEAQSRIVEALKPSFQAQKSIALEVSRINSWQNTFRSITDSLKDFRPAAEVLKDALVIEKEQFSQEDINRIAEEYIWDENSDKNIFRQDGKHLSWESIPKPVRWLIALVVATVFAIYLTAIWKEATKGTVLDPEKVARQFIHSRKQEVRQINKNHQSNTYPTFVNTEYLLVRKSPKRRIRAIAALSYPCEVEILEFKNKKRWVLIEWENEFNEVNRGWVLGRYIYRKNTLK